jgi:hypothetical protein
MKGKGHKEKFESLVSKANALDMRLVVNRVSKFNPSWSKHRLSLALSEYRKWLVLCAMKEEKLGLGMTSADVDEVWHMHILFTKKYMDDCQSVLGRYLHHNPQEVRMQLQSVSNSKSYTKCTSEI